MRDGGGLWTSRSGGGGGTGPLLGVGGGAVLAPIGGGGTPNLEQVSPGSWGSSTGFLGGLGGGGGPGFDRDGAWVREGALLFVWAYFPASGKGGGAANRGGCPEGQRKDLSQLIIEFAVSILTGGPLGGEGSLGGVGSL
jgi:hypothetical protein